MKQKITLKTLHADLMEIKNLLKPKEIKQETKSTIRWTKIGNLEWSEDLGVMNWYEAEEKCKEAGGRLPTIEEWRDLHRNYKQEAKEMLKTSAGYGYWSATTLSYRTQYAWSTYLGNGYTGSYLKTDTTQVRCVR